jgi:ubiquinone/menaquinone biosynthesis C-methylase UbiE
MNKTETDINSDEHLYELRIEALAEELTKRLKFLNPKATSGLDIGCQRGYLTERIQMNTGITFVGIEPYIKDVTALSRHVKIIQGYANKLPFTDSTFDFVLMISVLEHIQPNELKDSLSEVHRVLKYDGFLLIQIPNMNFPIEVHSRLPFQQFLPRTLGDKYLSIFTHGRYKKSDWYRISPKKIISLASQVGLSLVNLERFQYPKSVFPKKFLFFYPILKIIPLDFVLTLKRESVR